MSRSDYYSVATIDTPAKASEKVVNHFQKQHKEVVIGQITSHVGSETGYDVSVTFVSPSGNERRSTYFVPTQGGIRHLKPAP